MRYGFKTNMQDATWSELLALWRAADEIDTFEHGWNADHFYPIASDPAGPCLEAWTGLAALAQATRRIRIGCLVTGMAYRHPALLANMAATVDHVSEGRLELGLGTGSSQPEFDAYGIALGSMSERFARLDEGLAVITSLLTRPTTTFDGRYFQLVDARCEPKPLQPRIPICIGGHGERRTLPIVARWADHWNVISSDPDAWRRKRDILHGYCAAIGRDPRTIHTSVQIDLWPMTDPEALAARVDPLAAAGVEQVIVRLKPALPAHDLDRIATTLEDVRA